jgi:hypothetical protein
MRNNRKEQINNFEYYLCDQHFEKIDKKLLLKYAKEYDKKLSLMENNISKKGNKTIYVKQKTEKCVDCIIF